jgi:hypothetical protein
MRMKRCVWGFLFILSLIALGACRQAAPAPTPEPTEAAPVPVATPTEASAEPVATVTETEARAPDQVVAARDAVLAHLGEQHSEDAPAPGLTWSEERATPQGLIGAETYRYTAEDWVMTISYPVVAPDMVTYQVVVSNPSTAFQWQGEVSATGDVTEFAAADPVLAARNAAFAYLSDNYPEQAPASDLTWTRRRMTPEGLVGAETYQYRSGYWVASVSYPVVAPDAVVYRLIVSNESTGFQWQGEVNTDGSVTETAAPITGRPVVGWYGLVVSGPIGAEFDAYLALEPEGTGEVGLVGAEASMDVEIDTLRDSGTHAHVWGTLLCDTSEQSCQLVVTRLRRDEPGPLFDPDVVERWEGTLVSTPEGAQFDDYFVLTGDFAVHYGIDSTDAALAAQLESLRDTQTTIRVWGRLTTGVPDVNGSQIAVIAIEVAGDTQPPASVLVSGWVGAIIPFGAGAQYDDYFERQDGERFGIDATDEDMQKRIVALRTTRSWVRIWGQLVTGVPDVEGRQIQLERYEIEPRSQAVDGWVGIIVPLEPGAEYDDYFERDDGERYGIETADAKLARRLEALRTEGTRVMVWGELLTDVPDVESRQIVVVEIEVVE